MTSPYNLKDYRKSIYLCGPLASRTDEEANEWRKKAIESLEEENLKHIPYNTPISEVEEAKRFKCINPMRRLFETDGLERANEIVQLDKKDIQDSDMLLVNYNCARQETTLCGTAMEVFYAHSLGKTIVAFTDLPKEKLSPWMVYHCTKICSSLEEALNYIEELPW